METIGKKRGERFADGEKIVIFAPLLEKRAPFGTERLLI